MMKTATEVKNEFNRKGETVTAWAKKHGFCRVAVHRVMNGESKALRGKSHRIAVMLGLKDGEVIPE